MKVLKGFICSTLINVKYFLAFYAQAKSAWVEQPANKLMLTSKYMRENHFNYNH